MFCAGQIFAFAVPAGSGRCHAVAACLSVGYAFIARSPARVVDVALSTMLVRRSCEVIPGTHIHRRLCSALFAAAGACPSGLDRMGCDLSMSDKPAFARITSAAEVALEKELVEARLRMGRNLT